jgi:hypothetical protein
MRSKQMILIMSRDSPNKIIPNIATATVPIPVHTAYAVPIGIVFMATDNSQKLMAIAKTVNSDGLSLVNPSVYFKPIAHPHSNKPANTKQIQFILLLHFLVLLPYRNQSDRMALAVIILGRIRLKVPDMTAS